MKGFLVLLLFIAVLFVSGWYVSSNDTQEMYAKDIEYTDGTLAFEDGAIQIAFALTGEERTSGLSRQREIKENEGLLFIFNESDEHGIWMRDMYFPIDIIWLDTDLAVVDIKENAAPESYRSLRDAEVFSPRTPARYVLEVYSGFVDAHNIAIGDTFSLVTEE